MNTESYVIHVIRIKRCKNILKTHMNVTGNTVLAARNREAETIYIAFTVKGTG